MIRKLFGLQHVQWHFAANERNDETSLQNVFFDINFYIFERMKSHDVLCAKALNNELALDGV